MLLQVVTRSYLRGQRQIVMSLDDTGLPKRSRMIKACSWLRDPLGPKFRTNFVWGLRCLHAIVHLPPQAKGLGATGISIDFELAPPPKKPRAKAPEEDRAAYQAAKKTHSLTARGVVMLKRLREECDAEGLKQDILAVGDGGYALLKLAGMKAFGPTRTADYHELPQWRSRRDREGLRKPSANDLLTRLRADLAEKVHSRPPDGQLPPRETYAAA